MKKVLAITGIRSDYDLISGLLNLLNNDSNFDLQLLVGGAHLSKQFGNSIDVIDEDGFKILIKIESLINSDSLASRLKSASIFLQCAVDVVSSWNPDFILYAGDREEVIIGGMLGNYLGKPTVHFYGGDHTNSGHVDNPIRHATSKLSTVHFVMTKEHAKRIMAIGESEDRVFVVGNMSLDNFRKNIPLKRAIIEHNFKLKIKKLWALVIFHPDPSEINIADKIFENILTELENNNFLSFVGFPNSDPGNSKIIDVIKRFENNKNFFFYKNLMREDFISIYKNSNLIIGNSSSGIIESASIPIPAINVGLRQRGRYAGENVIFCDGESNSIKLSIEKALSIEFLQKIKTIVNPYGDGQSCKKSYDLIKKIDFESLILKTEDPIFNK